MGGFKTVISANISVDVAKQLQNKTKGTRSRVVERALRAYLADREAFNIGDYPTRNVMAALLSRDDCPEHIKILLLQELNG
tara:strand:+ start:716 stop:958 length:243 start_codon:yes stop_codon:yes gene_type:complete